MCMNDPLQGNFMGNTMCIPEDDEGNHNNNQKSSDKLECINNGKQVKRTHYNTKTCTGPAHTEILDLPQRGDCFKNLDNKHRYELLWCSK
jgi:hypothetical protein